MDKFPHISVSDLADYILAKSDGVSPLKLHKLIYYIEAWHLSVLEQSIIDEDFEAWLHGPAIRSLFGKLRGQGFLLYEDIVVKDEFKKEYIDRVDKKLSPEQKELILDVLSEYGGKSAYYLECLTHAEKPWIEARKGVAPGEPSSNKISKKTMREFYRSQLG